MAGPAPGGFPPGGPGGSPAPPGWWGLVTPRPEVAGPGGPGGGAPGGAAVLALPAMDGRALSRLVPARGPSGEDNPEMAGLIGRFAPAIFVLLWASGFVVARLVRPFVEPEGFVSIRFALSAMLLAGVALLGRAAWPRTAEAWGNSFVAGVLMQGVYVGGVFWSIKNGLPAAVAALISGTQPLLTAVLAWPLLRERVSGRRWLGIVVGFVGAVLVLLPNLRGAAAVPMPTVLACVIGTAGITLGTIWQKRIGGSVDLRSGAAIQFLGGLAVTVPLALLFEARAAGGEAALANTPRVWIGLGWAVVIVSTATTLLLLRLLREGAVARVTALFYLVPPVTALMTLALFGDGLVPVQIAGMLVASAGVARANRG